MVSHQLRYAVKDLDGPFAVLDLNAFRENIDALRRRAHGMPIRVASKSLRSPQAIEFILDHDGYAGVLGFSLPEALQLVDRGIDDVLVAYPTVHRAGLQELAADPARASKITLMVDSTAHLDVIEQARTAVAANGAEPAEIRVCLDVDASLRPAESLLKDTLHLGPRRSPIRQVEQAVTLVEQIIAHPGVKLVGVMSYEGLIAGQADAGASPKQAIVRRLQAANAKELAQRRTEVIAAIRSTASAHGVELEFVNGGGTGSLELSAAEGSLTELAAGSGFYFPGLFDGYRGFSHNPALFFATPVVRIPAPGWVTVYSGGYIASGPPGPDRLPTIDYPENLKYSGNEGPGEVQTPLHGPGTTHLDIGDPVFFRHAKAGELAEHFNHIHVVDSDRIIDIWTTYRGEQWAF